MPDGRNLVRDAIEEAKRRTLAFRHIDLLSEATGLTREQLRRLITAFVEDPDVTAGVLHRVNLEHATGRPATDDGLDVEDPPPLRVKMLQDDHAGARAGSVVEKPYKEAVWLLNRKLAVLPQ